MKTITFYSYKGGVGRSLALSNIARRLSELNKKVCILDFDLDAPGLQFKFTNTYNIAPIKKGIVDYIYDFSSTGNIPDHIIDYVTQLKSNNITATDIALIPAGDIHDNQYWKKLSMIPWADMFYSEEANGIEFFLDLKHKIETELKPDFLLIDSRTGITDISGITLRLFADEVVVLGVNNDENIFGSKMIIKNLLNKDGALFGVLPKVHFVLTRIPFTDSPDDKSKKVRIIDLLTSEFKEHLDLEDFHINLIHSDRRLEEQERQLIGYSLEEKSVSISNDYLNLFKLLTSDLLTEEELKALEIFKASESEYIKFVNEPQLFKKLEYISNAINLSPTNSSYLFARAYTYNEMGNKESALNEYLKILDLVPEKSNLAELINNNIAVIYTETNQYAKAIEYNDKQINSEHKELSLRAYRVKKWILGRMENHEGAKEMAEYIIHQLKVEDDSAYNSLADYYRRKKMFREAYTNVFKAIELNPQQPIYLATLAEINEAEGKIEEFYMNFTLALSKGLNYTSLKQVLDIYLKYENDQRMIDLLNQYDITFDAIKALS